MDCRTTLDTIARLLPTLPEVEDQLVVFDSLVGVSEVEHRPEAAQMLRDAAARCQDAGRRERLLKAADAVAAGEPCAFTPEGLSAKQAAAAQTVTAEEWKEPAVEEREELEEEEEEPDESDYMEEAPPKVPDLPVRHFFDGLVVRVAQDFVDAKGRAFFAGDVHGVLDCVARSEGGYRVELLVRSVSLPAPGCEAAIENAGNAWFQPVPSRGCLLALFQAIDRGLSDAEEDEKMDDDIERLEAIRGDVDDCEDWLAREGKGGLAPVCRSGALAARVFGRDHHVTVWIRLLFAGVVVALPEE